MIRQADSPTSLAGVVDAIKPFAGEGFLVFAMRMEDLGGPPDVLRHVDQIQNLDSPLRRLRIKTIMDYVPLTGGAIQQHNQRLIGLQAVMRSFAGPDERFDLTGNRFDAVTQVTFAGESGDELFRDGLRS